MARKGMVKWVCSLACAAVALALAVTLAPALPQALASETATTTQERTAVDVGLEKQSESQDSASSEEELAEPTAEPAIQLTSDGFSILRTTSQLKNGAALAMEMNDIVVISVTTPVYVTFGAENAYDIEADAPLDTFTATAPVTFQNTGTAYARMAGITCTDEGATTLLTKDGTTPIDETNRIFKLSNGTDTPVTFGPVAGTSNANTVGASDLGTSFDIPDRSDATTSGAKTFTYTLDLTNTQVNTSAVDEMEVGGSVSMELASVVYTFEAATTTITWNENYEGGTITTETPNYATSATVTLPTAPEREGYTFLGWFTEDGTPVLGGEDLPTTPTTYYAHWEQEVQLSYIITFDAGEGRFSDGSHTTTQEVQASGTITAPENPTRAADSAGVYAFAGWSREGSTTVVDPASEVPTGDVTYVAQWSQSGSTTAAALYCSDGSLIFTYIDNSAGIAAGSSYNGKTVTAVYTGFLGTTYNDSDLPPWNTYMSSITSVTFETKFQPVSSRNYFMGATSLATVNNLENLDTSEMTTLTAMFYNCSSLTSLDLRCWDVSNVTTYGSTFYGCSNLVTLNLSGWNTSGTTNMYHMFYGCSKLTTIYVSDDSWTVANLTRDDDMFRGCTSLVGGNGTSYSSSYIDRTYARVDKSGQKGYLTEGSTSAVAEISIVDMQNVTNNILRATLVLTRSE